MGIEQQNNEKRYEDEQRKKENQETLDFFEAKKLKIETSNLLQNLAAQIADDFGMDISEVRNLISSSTLGDLDNLKSGISSNTQLNLEDFKLAINSAKSKIAELSKNQIDSLKNSLDTQKYNPEKHEYMTSKRILPDSLLQKAYNPQNFGDQLTGIGVGIFDSTEAVILFTYALGKGVLLTPYHIYLILTGKGKYDGWETI